MRAANIRVKIFYRKEFLQDFFVLSISITNILPGSLFQNIILDWYKRNKRDLPWRKTSDPYRIWLSEVILQQTRVEQGLPYYLRFVKNYPSVTDLAMASEDRILKDWEGLGYYSRARNLHAAANQVVKEYNGELPKTYKELVKLKGVGDYTASAISSIASGESQAVLDGNVYRVLARYFGIKEPINSGAGQRVFKQVALEMLNSVDPGTHNQAMMEFGALHCTPRNPNCVNCDLKSGCIAHNTGQVDLLPVKNKGKKLRDRFFTYIIFRHQDLVYLEKRSDKDIWKGLYQFWLTELDNSKEPRGYLADFIRQQRISGELLMMNKLKPHKLSHQRLHISLGIVELDKRPEFLTDAKGLWVEIENLHLYAFPRPLRQFQERNQLTLRLD